MVLNFDDTEYEPTVLPARFPNLLVNGATGISAGYATEIPTHNLDETIQATIYLMKHPEATLDELMQFVKGPDFPTGGILQGLDGIKKAYETGRGRTMLRAKTTIEALRGGKSQIVVTEIPYEVNKAMLVKKIDEVRLLKKVEGIAEVRDESDRDGLRIVIELKKNANATGILNYLFKNTDLQISYNFNMVAIDHKRPEHVGLKQILTSYLEHQRTVTTKRTEFDLDKAKQREHIVLGLIKALSILDQVIKVIRGSKNKKDATKNLMSNFDFTKKQAEAIVSLQLYRLTNTDVTALEKEAKDLQKQIASFEKILGDPKELDKVIRKELQAIAKKYASPRKTEIQEKIQSLKIETEVMVAQEEVVVQISREGYVKRSSLRSFNASDANDNGLRDDDEPILQDTVNTLDHLFIFTNKGNLIYRPIHEITEARFKDTGEHLSQTVGLDNDERVIAAKVFKSLDEAGNFVFATKEGYIKQTSLVDLKPGRTYKSRASRYITLKTDSDEVISLYYTQDQAKELVCVSYNGYGLRYNLDEVPVTGARAAGVKCMDLRDDTLKAVLLTDEAGAVGILTTRGSFKKMKITEIPLTSRARRGVQILRELKTKPHRIAYAFLVEAGQEMYIKTTTDKEFNFDPVDHGFSERYSNGSYIFDAKNDGEPQTVKLLQTKEVTK